MNEIDKYKNGLISRIKFYFRENQSMVENIEKINLSNDFNIAKKQIDYLVLNEIADHFNNITSNELKQNIFSSDYIENTNCYEPLIYNISTQIVENIDGIKNHYNFEKTLLKLDSNITNDNLIEIVKRFYDDLINSSGMSDKNKTKLINRLNEILKKDENNNYEKINFINGDGRPVVHNGEINLYRHNNYTDLIGLVHEISHMITEKNKNHNYDYRDNAIEEFESMIMEQLFCKYMVEKNLNCFENGKTISNKDIDLYRINCMDSVIRHSFRTISEMDFYSHYRKNGNKFDLESLGIYAHTNDVLIIINECGRINRILTDSYIINDEHKELLKSGKYDLHNGKHLSNEIRFIYAGIFSSNFIDIINQQNIDKYLNYISNAEKYNLEDYISLFQIEKKDLNCLIYNFTNKYLELDKKYGKYLDRQIEFHKSYYKSDERKKYLNSIRYNLLKNKQLILKSPIIEDETIVKNDFKKN